LHAFTGWQLATRHVFGARFVATAGRRFFKLYAKVVNGGLQGCGIGQEIR
jgi:hypothetical protein